MAKPVSFVTLVDVDTYGNAPTTVKTAKPDQYRGLEKKDPGVKYSSARNARTPSPSATKIATTRFALNECCTRVSCSNSINEKGVC